MKPENYRKNARKARSRARMYMTLHLGWLRGFPGGSGEWVCFPDDGAMITTIHPDPERLRRTTYTYYKLMHRFPHALPAIVEDRDRWIAGVALLLEHLKTAVHASGPLPSSLIETPSIYPARTIDHARRIVRTHPALQPLLDTLSWILLLSPGELPAALTWVQTHASMLGNMHEDGRSTLDMLVLFEAVRKDGDARLAPVFTLLYAHPIFHLPGDGGIRYVERWITALGNKQLPPTESPALLEVTFGDDLLDFLRELLPR